MDLRALRYFVHVAEARSFSKAAVQLRIAQPALSRQIRKLEDEVGLALILRTRRQLELTDAGLLLLQRAHSLLRQAAQTADDVRAHGSRVQGTLTLGVSPTICEALVPCIARECAALHPELRLSFVEGFSGFVFQRLINQELTLCLMHNPPRHRGIEIEPLLTEPMYLIGPGAASGTLPPAAPGMALDRVPLILPNRTHGLRMLVERGAAEYGGHLDVAFQVDGYTTTKALVVAGLGYTILPYSAVRREAGAGLISAVRLRKPALPAWTLSAAYRKDQGPARAVTALRNIIAATVDKLAADGFWDELGGTRGQGKRDQAKRNQAKRNQAKRVQA
ncbi:MAG TPA: LysR family transcriptional regulator [Xanthobacteraceae bacterium]|jgi:LysR family nitrogen assimilation transcriptional regulator|nr:LysR family transcriptional regulator [Xanthobacteraceae bacterium]